MTRTNTLVHRVAVAACAVAAVATVGSGVAALSAPAQAAPVLGPMRTQAPTPGPGELQSVLTLAIDQGAPRAERATALEAGEAGLAMADQLADVIAVAPPSLRWSVSGPVRVEGDLAYAQLVVTADGFEPYSTEISFRQTNGTWKLSRAGQCAIAAVAGLPCTV